MWRPERVSINQERASQWSTLPEDIDQGRTGRIMDASVEDDARGVLRSSGGERKSGPDAEVQVQDPDAMPSLEVGRPKKGTWLWSVWCLG